MMIRYHKNTDVLSHCITLLKVLEQPLRIGAKFHQNVFLTVIIVINIYQQLHWVKKK